MITYKFSRSALENIEECGVDVEADVEALRSGATSRAALLEHCLDGADADRVEGWRDYVSTVALRAGVNDDFPPVRKSVFEGVYDEA